MEGLEIRVQLLEVEEKVERVLQIPKNYTLKQLHTALQIAMGWKDLKDYYFFSDKVLYSEIDYRIEDLEFVFSDQIKLEDIKEDVLSYSYDGDTWKHRIEFLEEVDIEDDFPKVLSYCGKCPMEEYGGPTVYNEMIKESPQIIPDFDLEETNHILEISFK